MLYSNHFDTCMQCVPAESRYMAHVRPEVVQAHPRAADLVAVAGRVAGRPAASRAGL